jgi:hypothetical protein
VSLETVQVPVDTLRRLELAASEVRGIARAYAPRETPNEERFPVVGAYEASKILGVNRQRVYALAAGRHKPRTRFPFPPPCAELRQGVVWWREDVERWKAERDIRLGRAEPSPDLARALGLALNDASDDRADTARLQVDAVTEP